MAKAQPKKAAVRTKRRERKNIEKGQVHIRSSFNNTIVTITDLKRWNGLKSSNIVAGKTLKIYPR